MKTWVALWAGAGMLLLAAAILDPKKRRGARWMASAALVPPCAVCWLGMDFSPSFTLIFLTIGLCTACLAECLERLAAGRHPALSGVASGLFALEYLWAIPAVCIYAAGDDLFDRCLLGAVAGGLVLALVLQRRDPRVPAFLMAWLCWGVVVFTALCGVNSVALLPCAAGLGLMLAGRRWQPAAATRKILFFAGALLTAWFAALPGLL